MLAILAVIGHFETDLRHRLVLGREVTQQAFGVELPKLLDRHADQRAWSVSHDRLSRTIGEDASKFLVRVTLVARKPQNAV